MRYEANHQIGYRPASALKRTARTCAAIVLILCSSTGWTAAIDQAKQIHDRIAGVPPSPDLLLDMRDAISSGNALAAALMATDQPQFYNVTLKNFAAPWTNRDGSVFVPLDDYIATVIGMVRDDVDFRELL